MDVAGFITGLQNFLSLEIFFWVIIGTIIGIVFGALPGLTATTAVAIFLPMTFYMELYVSLAFLLGIYCGGYYAGSIPAILIKTPGAPGNAATALDGYPMACRGEADKALQLSVISSWIGGTFSALCLLFFAPIIGRMALKFGPAEYFSVAVLGLTAIVGVSGKNLTKGIASAAIGMLLATVGIDPVSGVTRFTFGSPMLIKGFALVPTMIGFFAISEAIQKAESYKGEIPAVYPIKKLLPDLRPYWRSKWTLLKSSIIGTVVGAVPGTGSSIAAWLAYNEGKRSSKQRDDFGKGAPEGIMCVESSNNAVTGGALIPLLTLGVPGDVTTAVIINALIIQGIQPGPHLTTERYDLIITILLILILSNIAMLLIGLCCARVFPYVLRVKSSLLVPVIIVLCTIGAFSAANSAFDVKVAVIIGIAAFLMVKFEMPLPPAVLGLVLGPILEPNMVRALTGTADWTVFFTRPLSLILLLTSVAFLGFMLYNRYKSSNKIDMDA